MTLGFFVLLQTLIVQSHNEGAKLQRDTEVAKSAKEVVSNYADETFAKDHLSLTTIQWKAKITILTIL